MKRILATLAVGGCGLVLLEAPGLRPLAAQERISEQTLIERLRQIQGQLGHGEPRADPPRHAEELIREIEVIERELRSAPASEAAALSEEEVRSLVQDGLGVEVLKAQTVERDGRQVYEMTVMNPPGDYNGAFMIRTLLVDGTTGDLVGEVAHAPRTGATDVSPGASAAGPDGSGLEIRRRTYR